MTDTHDIVIIGAGAAGLTAGIYAARANMNTLLVEKFVQIFGEKFVPVAGKVRYLLGEPAEAYYFGKHEPAAFVGFHESRQDVIENPGFERKPCFAEGDI